MAAASEAGCRSTQAADRECQRREHTEKHRRATEARRHPRVAEQPAEGRVFRQDDRRRGQVSARRSQIESIADRKRHSERRLQLVGDAADAERARHAAAAGGRGAAAPSADLGGAAQASGTEGGGVWPGHADCLGRDGEIQRPEAAGNAGRPGRGQRLAEFRIQGARRRSPAREKADERRPQGRVVREDVGRGAGPIGKGRRG